jgi:hypothetical protein
MEPGGRSQIFRSKCEKERWIRCCEAVWWVKALVAGKRPKVAGDHSNHLPGGEPRISETIASRAILMFCTDPRMWILLRAEGQRPCRAKNHASSRCTHVSARTIRVRLAFSIENLTLPPSPAIRPVGHQQKPPSPPRHLPQRPNHPTPQYRRYTDHHPPQRGTAERR